jgi:hypothetical protein
MFKIYCNRFDQNDFKIILSVNVYNIFYTYFNLFDQNVFKIIITYLDIKV